MMNHYFWLAVLLLLSFAAVYFSILTNSIVILAWLRIFNLITILAALVMLAIWGAE